VTDQRVFAQVAGGPQGDGTDQLTKIERLKFSDKSLAMDLDGNAGNAARLLCTVFGQAAVKDPKYAGILINVFDQGLTKEQISQLAIDFIFGAKSTSSDVVKLVWKNLVGTEIRDSDLNTFTSLIGEGRLFTDSKAFISAVSDLDVTAQVIDLVGLSKAGWEYIPYGG
jgi:hypothetical protein